jgi:hypothetical protein
VLSVTLITALIAFSLLLLKYFGVTKICIKDVGIFSREIVWRSAAKYAEN